MPDAILNCFAEYHERADLTEPDNNDCCKLSTFPATFSLKKKEVTTNDCTLIIFDYDEVEVPELSSATVTERLPQIASTVDTIIRNFGTQGVVNVDSPVSILGNTTTTAYLDTLKSASFAKLQNTSDYVNYTSNMPRFLDFRPSTSSEIVFRVWFSNAEFTANYDRCNTMIIAPFEGSSDIIRTDYAAFKAAVDIPDPFSPLHAKLEAEHGDLPISNTRHLKVPIYDPDDPSEFFFTHWLVVCNGNNACTIENLELAVLNYIFSNSVVTPEEGELVDVWATITPTLLAVKNFYIKPKWDQTAVSNEAAGIFTYNPAINIADEVDVSETLVEEEWGNQLIGSGNNPFGLEKLEYLVTSFKGLGCYVLPDLNNVEGRLSLTEIFTDFSMYDVNSQANSLVTLKTRDLLARFVSLLEEAEKHLAGEDITNPLFNEETINGKVHVISQIDDIMLKIQCRNQ